MKNIRFTAILAWRNVWRNPIRSLVIMIAVAAGMLAGLTVLALYKGMANGRVRKIISEETGHLQLHHPLFKKDDPPAYFIPDSDSVLRILSQSPDIKAVAPRTLVQGMMVSTTGSAGVQINGIDANLEQKISQIDKKIKAGKGIPDFNGNRVLIGKQLAEKLNTGTEKKIVITFSDSLNNILSSAHRVCGIFSSGNRQFDEWNIYVPVIELNKLMGKPLAANEIVVLLNHDEDLERMKASLQKKFPELQIQDWKELSPETALLVNTINDFSYLVIIILLLALAFGIVNTMLMSVLERTRELGMMMALGTSTRFIALMTLLETLLLTGVGIPAGGASALALSTYYEKKGIDFSGTGKEMMASFGFNTSIRPEFPWEKLPAVLLLILFIALLSWTLPALRVYRMRPVDAFRR